MDTGSPAWRLRGRAVNLAGVSRPSPETTAIIAVGATLLIAVSSVGGGLGVRWSKGQAGADAAIARTDAAISELRRDVGELRRDVQDVRERLARLELVFDSLEQAAPSMTWSRIPARAARSEPETINVRQD